MPGAYSSIDNDIYQKVRAVYDGLIAALKEEMSGLDIVDLCVSLYERNEQYLGNISKFRHHSIPEILLVGNKAATMKRQEIWQMVSPYPEAIRWLIEISVKCCQPTDTGVENAKLDRLIAMVRVTLEWDTAWEYVNYGVVPFVLTVRPDFTIEAKVKEQAGPIPQSYEKATEYWKVDADRKWIDGVSKALITEKTVDEVVNSELVWRNLNGPMEQEFGYNMADWLNYSCALMQSLAQSGDYVKVLEKERLGTLLLEDFGLDSQRFESLLTDHALMKQTVSSCGLDEFRPAEYAGRDSRLVRRPVVVLDGLDTPPICLYGIETLDAAARMFIRDFPAGRIRIPRMYDNGPLNRAIGTIQSNLGSAFRDEIATNCIDAGLVAVKEKDRAGTERIPQGVGFGPVDVFIVDKQHSRFVLAEVKDVDDPGMVPRKMAEQVREFHNVVDRLNLQVDWFRARVEVLKSDFGIGTGEDYLVEGVVVINYPRLWMYSDVMQLPIVTDRDFLETLGRGCRFEKVRNRCHRLK